MPKTYLEPASDFVLVIDNKQETTISGISLPDNIRQQEMIYGIVVEPGPLATLTKSQDRVMYGPYAGKTVVLEGIEFRLLKQGQIEAYLRVRNDDGTAQETNIG
jgi:co-chaperonin GroES (HSP10)